MQRLLNSAAWDEGLVRDDLCTYILEQLGDPKRFWSLTKRAFANAAKNRQESPRSIAAQLASWKIVRSGSFWPTPTPKATRCWIGNGICSSVESLFSNILCSDRFSLEEVTGCILFLHVGGSIGSSIHCYKSILHPYPSPSAHNCCVSPVY
jgi:hypothetical protein